MLFFCFQCRWRRPRAVRSERKNNLWNPGAVDQEKHKIRDKRATVAITKQPICLLPYECHFWLNCWERDKIRQPMHHYMTKTSRTALQCKQNMFLCCYRCEQNQLTKARKFNFACAIYTTPRIRSRSAPFQQRHLYSLQNRARTKARQRTSYFINVYLHTLEK